MIDEIIKAVKLLFQPGQLVEIRGKRLDGGMASAYYTDHERMARVLAKNDDKGEFEAIWFTLQRIRPGTDQTKVDSSTIRADITNYEWLVIDVDRPKPPEPPKSTPKKKKLNATDAELQQLAEGRDKIMSWLSSIGWPEPVVACSGNGWHLLYRLGSLPAEESFPLLTDVLKGVAYHFADISGKAEDGKLCNIDTTLAEPEQVIKAYGTMSRLSPEDGGDRPWRKSYIESIPNPMQTVMKGCLYAVQCELPSGETERSGDGEKGR